MSRYQPFPLTPTGKIVPRFRWRPFIVAPASQVVVNNLQLWLRPDDLTGADGSRVTSCPDFSGFNRHATNWHAGTGPVLKTNALNGKKVLQFANVAGERLGGATSLTTLYGTVFIVWRINTAAGSTARGLAVTDSNASGDSTGSHQRIFALRDFTNAGAGTYSANTMIMVAPVTLNQHFLQTVVFDGTNGKIAINNGSFITGSPTWPYPMNSSFYTIGAAPTGTSPLDGQIAEVLIYSVLLSDADIATTRNYLRTRFALP